MTPTIAMMGAVLLASLAGSPHCAGMCGVFVAMACGTHRDAGWLCQVRAQIAYHGGRLIGYIALGVLAGTLGGTIDLTARSAGFHHAAAILAATTMLVVGAAWLLREAGLGLPHVPTPGFVKSTFRAGITKADRFGASGRALAIGLLTALLPCGWLWAFAIIAGGTASPLWGGMVMATFWLGTVPILAAIGLGTGTLRSRLGPRLRTVAALAMIAIATVTVVRVYRADATGLIARHSAQPASLDTPPTEAHCPLCP
ncbi:MAG: sulfite exporter TauE/SafE family protein [Phycisphaerales bacterium JB060]